MSPTDPQPSPGLLGRLWPQLRAVLVAAHVLAVTLAAIPAPGGGMLRSAWADPTVQAEFEAWSGRLRAAGVAISSEELEERLWTLAEGYMGVRQQVLAPFDPYYRVLGTGQPWRMFVAPHRHPSRLHIEVEEAGQWRTVYVERSPEHTWLRRQLDHDRMRAALFRYSWRAYRRTWRQFGDWVAQQAADDFPQATRVRLRFHQAESPTPRQARAGELPEGRFQHVQVRRVPR